MISNISLSIYYVYYILYNPRHDDIISNTLTVIILDIYTTYIMMIWWVICHFVSYSKTSLPDPPDYLPRSTPPPILITLFGSQLIIQTINTIVMIFYLPNPTTSLNWPLNVGPMVDRFREVLHVYCAHVMSYISLWPIILVQETHSCTMFSTCAVLYTT